ncbi:MAG: LiaI-LiaF-like domain-containing protein [Thermoleophilia bacterium]
MTVGRLIPGAILVILGGLFLTANFGYLDWGVVASIWMLWPLILILIGIQLVFGKRQQWLAAILVVAVLAGGAALIVLGEDRVPWAFGGGLTTAVIEGPSTTGIGDATAYLDVGAARIDLGSQTAGVMSRGTFESRRRDPQVRHDVTGSTYSLDLRQQSGMQVFPNGLRGDRVNVDLAAGIPWKIQLDTGAADANLDLTDIMLRELLIDAGASSVDLTVGPNVEDGARVIIDGGAGSYTLRLPRSLDIDLSTDAGVSSVNVDQDFERTGDRYHHDGGGHSLRVELSAGVSSISVSLY